MTYTGRFEDFAEFGITAETMQPFEALQSDLPFHNPKHELNTALTALKTLVVLREHGLDPDSRIVIATCLTHDHGFHLPLDTSEYVTKEARTAALVEPLYAIQGFSARERRGIVSGTLATHYLARVRSIEDWVVRMSDVENIGRSYERFMATGVYLPVEYLTMHSGATEGEAIADWQKIGRDILPHYAATHAPGGVRDIIGIPGSGQFKLRAHENIARFNNEPVDRLGLYLEQALADLAMS